MYLLPLTLLKLSSRERNEERISSHSRSAQWSDYITAFIH